MFWKKFVSLCNKQGMSPNSVAAKLGFGSSSVTYWKNGTVPNGKPLAKIAEFFGIGVDDLLGTKKEPVPDLDPTTAALIGAFSRMNDWQRMKLMEIVSQMENEKQDN